MKRTFSVVPALPLVALVLLLFLATDGRGLLAKGLSYPVLGLPHLVAGIAVAVWSCRLGGDAPVVLPAILAAGLSMGYVLAAESVPLLLFVEPIIWISALALAIAAAYPVRVPLGDALGVTLPFGLYHGHALGELGSAEVFQIDAGVLTDVGRPSTLVGTIAPGLPPAFEVRRWRRRLDLGLCSEQGAIYHVWRFSPVTARSVKAETSISAGLGAPLHGFRSKIHSVPGVCQPSLTMGRRAVSRKLFRIKKLSERQS